MPSVGWVDNIHEEEEPELVTDALTQGVFVLRRASERPTSKRAAAAAATHKKGGAAAAPSTAPAPPPKARPGRQSRQVVVARAQQAYAYAEGATGSQDEDAEEEVINFPALLVGEAPASSAMRARAFQQAWAEARGNIAAVQEQMNDGTKAQLATYLAGVAYAAQTDLIHADRLPSAQAQPLPTGLLLAGGVNSADHSATFTSIAAHLRTEGNTVALVRSQELRQGGASYGLGWVLRCILRQLTREEQNDVVDMRPLEAWYAKQAAADDGDGGGARPVVVLVEDTECVEGDVLGDLALALSEAGLAFPCVLLLGLATSVDFLQALLPADAAARLQPTVFRLTSAVDCLEDLQREIFLTRVPRLMVGHGVLRQLHTHFMMHDFSVAALRRTLHAAALLHFSQQPLAHLAAEAWEAHAANDPRLVQSAVEALTPAELKYAKKEFTSLRLPTNADSHQVKAALVAALSAAPQRYMAWSVGIQVLYTAAKFTKLTHKAATMRELLRDASSSDFLIGTSEGAAPDAARKRKRGDGDVFLEELVNAVETLSGQPMHGLLAALEALVAQMPPEEVANRREEEGPGHTAGGEDAVERTMLAQLQSLRRSLQTASVEAAAREQEATQAAKVAEEAAEAEAPKNLTAREKQALAEKLQKEREASAMAVAAREMAQATRGTSAANKRRAILGVVAKTANDPKMAAWEARSGIGALLQRIVRRCLSTPPEAFPAHEALCFIDAARMREMLHPTPRPQLEHTLRIPQSRLQCRCCPVDGGLSSKLPDAALLYQLMDAHGEFINVQDWFQAFYNLHPAPQQKRVDDYFKVQGGSASARGRKGKAEQNAAGEEAAVAPPSGPVDAHHLEALQARFTLATAELQLLGLVRSTRRRKGEFVQRIAFDAPLTGEEAEAANDVNAPHESS